MASASDIADRALELAARFLEESRDDLAGMSGGDHDVLFRAAQLVRERADKGRHVVHSAEHLAFSLITAAHEQLRHAANPPADEAAGPH